MTPQTGSTTSQTSVAFPLWALKETVPPIGQKQRQHFTELLHHTEHLGLKFKFKGTNTCV